jgi:hypothetical protein
VAVGDYNTNPASNTNISGINVAEGCAAGNGNDAFRQLMADIAVMYAALPNTSTLIPKTGGVFTGNPTFTSAGGYHFNASTSAPGGKWTIQASGGGAPASPAEGDFWGEY